MANDGISIKQAMSQWHLTQAQAEHLDNMDGNKDDGKISGNVYDMAKTYYEEAHKDENKNETSREGLFNDLVSWIKQTNEILESMKKGTLFGQEEAMNDSTENKPTEN